MALLWVVALLPFADGSNPDPVPVDDDVTAGWTALLVFVGLIIAVVVLGVSLAKQLRKAKAARDAGVYGDPPVAAPDPAERSDVSPEPPSAAPR
jgi:hypothetical protein